MSTTIWKARLTVPASPARDHISGALNAPITLVEYGDYECPFCAAAHQVVKTIEARAGGGLRFVFRHFPMTSLHPHAELAAEAAEAAAAQGQFWEMHDMLYSNQQELEGPHLLAYATAIGLDVARFTGEVAAHVHLPKVSDDFMSGVRSGVNGTPTFYINGIRHDAGWDYPSLAAALQQAALATQAS